VIYAAYGALVLTLAVDMLDMLDLLSGKSLAPPEDGLDEGEQGAGNNAGRRGEKGKGRSREKQKAKEVEPGGSNQRTKGSRAKLREKEVAQAGLPQMEERPDPSSDMDVDPNGATDGMDVDLTGITDDVEADPNPASDFNGGSPWSASRATDEGLGFRANSLEVADVSFLDELQGITGVPTHASAASPITPPRIIGIRRPRSNTAGM
jgi:hypothetical protein